MSWSSLEPRVVVWSRDKDGKAKVRRIGFPLVPDFGGTVHGFCGTSLDACLSDLLEWTRRPTQCDAQRAYINESRVRIADGLLIVQPYSPQLFRQGHQPGPSILMDVLRRTKTYGQAKEAWEELEQAKAKKPQEYERWPLTMELPCRVCTLQNGGDEVRKEIRHFTTQKRTNDLWKIVARGADLECIQYQKTLRRTGEATRAIFCDICSAPFAAPFVLPAETEGDRVDRHPDGASLPQLCGRCERQTASSTRVRERIACDACSN